MGFSSRQRTLGSVAILAHAVTTSIAPVMQPSRGGYAEGMDMEDKDVDSFLKPFEENSKKQLEMVLLRKEGSQVFELVLDRSQKLNLLADHAFDIRECLPAASEFSGLRNRDRRRRRPAIGATTALVPPAIGAAHVRGAANVLTLRSRSRSRSRGTSRVLHAPNPKGVKFTEAWANAALAFDAKLADPVALTAFRRRGRPPSPAPPLPRPLAKARPKTPAGRRVAIATPSPDRERRLAQNCRRRPKTPAAADPAPHWPAVHLRGELQQHAAFNHAPRHLLVEALVELASSDDRHKTAKASDLRARDKTILTATSLQATHVQVDGRLVRRPAALVKAAKPPAVVPEPVVWREAAAASSSSGAAAAAADEAHEDDWGASWRAPSASIRPTSLAFDPAVASRHPAVANCTNTYTWNKWTKKKYLKPEEGSAAPLVEIRGFLCFLDNKRPGPDGLPISSKLGQPEPQANGWWRLPWISFDEAALPPEPLGDWETKAIWTRAWHGTKLRALYSTMYHGKLAASHDAELGHRFLEGKPGLYVFKDDLRAKAENYMQFVPLFQDGVFWSAVWEVFVDRSARVSLSKRHTDQWAQEERSARLAALWVCGRTPDSMEAGVRFEKRWHPEHEVNPLAQCFAQKRPRAPRTGCIGAFQRCVGEHLEEVFL